MARCMRLGRVITVTCRALGTAAARQQRALAAETADQDHITRKTFAEVQAERSEQAKRSVLISCSPNINEKTFLKYLSRHGEVANHFFFDSLGTHALVEFTNTEGIQSFLAATKIPDEDVWVLPFKSRFTKMKSQEFGQHSVICAPQSPPTVNKLLQKLCGAKSIKDQAHVLLEELQLTDESIRLRYLTSSLVGDVATACFPEASVLLFGSSVNSFGKMGCDLDLFLNVDSIKGHTSGRAAGPFVTEYWMRHVSSSRVAQQKMLSVVAECIDSFGPGCTQLLRILGARCPLVRFLHQPTSLQCDLTADNKIALRMSELLYIYGNIDSRVRPLVFTLRCWARVHGITSSVSGHWITNFALTTMILFFLQKRSPPVIPTLDKLKSLTGKKDKCIIEDNDCTFVSDLSKIKPSANTETIDTLLIEFLEFYGNFDFCKNCIDIRKGVEKNKPDSSPLYIQNPFEQSLNISKNVNTSQMERFVCVVQESAWTLQKQASLVPLKHLKPWGLATILLSITSNRALSAKKKKPSERLGGLLDSLQANDSKLQTRKRKPEILT